MIFEEKEKYRIDTWKSHYYIYFKGSQCYIESGIPCFFIWDKTKFKRKEK